MTDVCHSREDETGSRCVWAACPVKAGHVRCPLPTPSEERVRDQPAYLAENDRIWRNLDEPKLVRDVAVLVAYCVNYLPGDRRREVEQNADRIKEAIERRVGRPLVELNRLGLTPALLVDIVENLLIETYREHDPVLRLWKAMAGAAPVPKHYLPTVALAHNPDVTGATSFIDSYYEHHDPDALVCNLQPDTARAVIKILMAERAGEPPPFVVEYPEPAT